MQKNYLEVKEKCDAKLGGVFFKRKQCFLSVCFKTKITQVNVKRKLDANLAKRSEKKVCFSLERSKRKWHGSVLHHFASKIKNFFMRNRLTQVMNTTWPPPLSLSTNHNAPPPPPVRACRLCLHGCMHSLRHWFQVPQCALPSQEQGRKSKCRICFQNWLKGPSNQLWTAWNGCLL